jgi:hypothetical protein
MNDLLPLKSYKKEKRKLAKNVAKKKGRRKKK